MDSYIFYDLSCLTLFNCKKQYDQIETHKNENQAEIVSIGYVAWNLQNTATDWIAAMKNVSVRMNLKTNVIQNSAGSHSKFDCLTQIQEYN